MKNIKVNAVLNSIRQFSSIAFSLITFPYITRVLGTDYYGRINFCNSIVGYFGMIASLGFSAYAIREGSGYRENRNEFSSFGNRIFSLNIASTLLAYILLGFFLLFWNRPTDHKVLVIIGSISIFLTTIGMEWVYIIYEDFTYITVRSIAVHILSIISLFLFVHTEQDYIIYAVLICISGGLSNILNFCHARKYINIRIKFDKSSLTHLKPIFIIFFNAALVTIYLNSDITILRMLQPEGVVGQYGVAVRIYSIVKSVIAAVVAVSVPRLAFYVRTDNQPAFQKLINDAIRTLLTVCGPALTGLVMVSRDVILIMSGEEYLGGTSALQILCFALMFATLANLLTSGVLIANKKEKIVLTASIISASVNVILNFLIIPYMSLNGAALTTLLAEMIVFAISLYHSKKFVHLKNSLSAVLPVGAGCAGIIIICFVIDYLISNVWIALPLKVVISAGAYLGIQILLKNNVIKDLFIWKGNKREGGNKD